MYLDYYGNDLPENALELRETKAGGLSISIWWNKVPRQIMTYDKINEVLDKLDKKGLPKKETKKGCYTIATTGTLGTGYFIRYGKSDANRIEVCGASTDSNKDTRLFRVCVSLSYDDEFGALDAWIAFQSLVNEKIGKKLSQIFGGLPMEYLKNRYCVPSPINWASGLYMNYEGSVAENCVKADICSAYGTEASKTLPDCHISRGKVVQGRVPPTKELPFAFYLESGHMAIWNEGDTFELNKSPYITCDHTIFCQPEKDRTLLLPVAENSLAEVFEELYEGRKDDPHNKLIMNATIGMFHRKKTRLQEDNLWPIPAVIKYRCNKRIIDTCQWLRERDQLPILINTDSILWEGEWQDDFYEVFSNEKKLGNFTIEYRKCRAVIRSTKIYQVEDAETGEVITRWSGSHSKKYTSLLRFGQIWQKDVYDFLREVAEKNTIKWDKKRCRYINRHGDTYYNIDEDIQEVLLKWQSKD